MSSKVEDDMGVKMEMDGEQQPRFLDDADYEDTGDLEIPKPLSTAWLARIPGFLYKTWEALEDDEEVQVGVIRHYKNTNTWKLLTDPSKHSEIPQDYTMAFESAINNTFVFSERDLPGYKSNQKQSDNKPGRSSNGIDKRGRFQRYSKTVPKQTALRAAVDTKIECHADQKQFEAYARKEALKAAKKPTGVLFWEGDPREVEERVRANNSILFDTISRGVKAKVKSHQIKATRMPENELRDALFECFTEIKYWPMKALRNRLQQPEAYLKEVLANIADLVRAGAFAATYTLKPEYQNRAGDNVKEEIASEGEGGTDADLSMKEDDDDVDLSMNE